MNQFKAALIEEKERVIAERKALLSERTRVERQALKAKRELDRLNAVLVCHGRQPVDSDEGLYMSVTDAMAYLGVSSVTIYHWLKEGKLERHKRGKSTLVSRVEAERLKKGVI